MNSLRHSLRLFSDSSRPSLRRILIASLLAGVANGLLLAITNHAAELVASAAVQTRYFILYGLAFTLYLYTLKVSTEEAARAIEEAIYELRIRLTDKLRRVELEFVERSHRNDLLNRVIQNCDAVSQAAPQISGTIQTVIFLLCGLAYLAWVSPLSFALAAGLTALFALRFARHLRVLEVRLTAARAEEMRLADTLGALFEGFKEIRLNRGKSDDLLKAFRTRAAKTRDLKVDVAFAELLSWNYARIAFYLLIPLLIFVVPHYHAESVDEVYKVTATLLYISGSVTSLAYSLAMVTRTTEALGALDELERNVDESTRASVDVVVEPWTDFSEISLEHVRYAYDASSGDGFTIGPVDLNLRRGELVFLVGGNGSGKSTLLKLLTGLYFPQVGRLRCDGRTVVDADYLGYRELFSTVFTDFHLFDQLLGLGGVDPQRVNAWLDRMELAGKTAYAGGAFTQRELSTGQRKRLAFVAAVLEDRPILVLDELAADQDPEFRQCFYEQILPELKAEGRTILAVTHDDRFFHLADRVIKMDSGRIVSEP